MFSTSTPSLHFFYALAKHQRHTPKSSVISVCSHFQSTPYYKKTKCSTHDDFNYNNFNTQSSFFFFSKEMYHKGWSKNPSNSVDAHQNSCYNKLLSCKVMFIIQKLFFIILWKALFWLRPAAEGQQQKKNKGFHLFFRRTARVVVV